ncbi:MAG TPA: DUF6320 domain-containing protein [Clostridia bacterium]|nr:MAG: hypothetical protein BWX97_01308 [Firmicutes bacterium ADurb.Bin146]HOD93378.1 DUF6320 domain-containing protein [Clostridia bacterium]HQM38876.1 DUF6320 domain-containing protein [Clostridia bacterium]
MPYCVKCGVELDKSAKKCVLCNTEIMIEQQEGIPPYPKEKAEDTQMNTAYFAILLSIILTIPNVACLVINLIYSPGIYWMYYVFGGSLVLWMIFIFPMTMKKKKPLLHVFLIFISATLYLLLIALALSGMRWFLTIALPLCITIMMLLFIIIFIVNKKKPGKLKTTSISLIGVIILCFVIEGTVDYFVNSIISLSWSYIVAASIVPVILALILLSGNKKLQNELIKKLHI